MLIPLAIAVLAIAAFAAWRGASGITRGMRWLLFTLRLTAVAAALVLLFNPGQWIYPTETQPSPWIILNDVSSSMAQATTDGATRAAVATSLIHQATAQAKAADIPLRIQPFAAKLEAATSAADGPTPAGTASNILPAVAQVLQDASAAGEALAGIIVLSDGRQTLTSTQADLDALGLRARSRNLAVHTIAIGADAPAQDLALIQPRASLTAFAGQPLRIPFALKSTGLAPIRPAVSLRDASGKELTSLTLELPPNKTASAVFEVKAPPASTHWTLETPVIPGETRSSNNTSAVSIRILESKTRVFLVEGAPYWDSKFLAQLLRQQPHMDVQSVHRLSDERYFHIDSGDTKDSETKHPVFPNTLDELCRYDLIVFGKNIDPFLTPERAAILRSYVRDRGGAVLFSRGKPSTASLPALEPLEPVVWATASTAEFRFTPTRDGAAAGLFGQALPAPDASLWAALPTLKDGRQIAMVKPFTRVLAEGVPDRGTNASDKSGPGMLPGSSSALPASGKFPALLVRRYGQGVTGLVNGDGLWKWDFFPEARELGNCYEDFWTQLIQWMASYSEFLPGQDFSLRLPATRGASGATLAATISYRGPNSAPQPLILITNPSGAATKVSPAATPDPSGRPLWRAAFTPDQPGLWSLKLIDPRPDAPPPPEVPFNVPAPPQA
ncbi:MAG: vWA domain-containing protein, partial [Verrucomicrobiota bacterium]